MSSSPRNSSIARHDHNAIVLRKFHSSNTSSASAAKAFARAHDPMGYIEAESFRMVRAASKEINRSFTASVELRRGNTHETSLSHTVSHARVQEETYRSPHNLEIGYGDDIRLRLRRVDGFRIALEQVEGSLRETSL